MNKKNLVVLFITIIVCITIILIVVISNLLLTKKDISKEKDYLYDKAINYLVSKEEPHYYLEDKNSIPNTDIEDFKVFSSLKKLGIEADNNKIYVYAYIAIESYYMQDGKLVLNSGSFSPYKFTIENDNIIQVEKPDDGSRNRQSTEEIFPKEIVYMIQEINSDNSDLRLDLEKQVDEYYSREKVNNNYVNLNS